MLSEKKNIDFIKRKNAKTLCEGTNQKIPGLPQTYISVLDNSEIETVNLSH